jgi:hypothetical protein
MASISSSSYIGISEYQQSVDDDSVCNAINCQNQVTEHFELTAGERKITITVRKNCVKQFEDEQK